VEALFRDPSRLPRLLEGLENGEIPARDIDALRRTALLEHHDARIRSRSRIVFAAAGELSRQDVLRSYADALATPGDVDRGREVFARSCTPCHRAENLGTRVGPDLAGVRGWPLEAVMIDILTPNRKVETRYVNHVAITIDGRVFSGIVERDAKGVTLRRGGGVRDELRHDEIAQLTSTGLSLMPEGLDEAISESDMADLIGFIGTLYPLDPTPRKRRAD